MWRLSALLQGLHTVSRKVFSELIMSTLNDNNQIEEQHTPQDVKQTSKNVK